MKKTCPKCGQTKVEEQFNWRNKEENKKQSLCRECQRDINIRHYRAHKQEYKDRARKRNNRIKKENSFHLFEYLQDKKCIDCGEPDPLVLDFDHVRQTKQSNVAWMVHGGYAWKSILQEITKCDIRCANCHRRKTALQQGWMKLKWVGGHGDQAESKSAGQGSIPCRPAKKLST